MQSNNQATKNPEGKAINQAIKNPEEKSKNQSIKQSWTPGGKARWIGCIPLRIFIHKINWHHQPLYICCLSMFTHPCGIALFRECMFIRLPAFSAFAFWLLTDVRPFLQIRSPPGMPFHMIIWCFRPLCFGFLLTFTHPYLIALLREYLFIRLPNGFGLCILGTYWCLPILTGSLSWHSVVRKGGPSVFTTPAGSCCRVHPSSGWPFVWVPLFKLFSCSSYVMMCTAHGCPSG